MQCSWKIAEKINRLVWSGTIEDKVSDVMRVNDRISTMKCTKTKDHLQGDQVENGGY